MTRSPLRDAVDTHKRATGLGYYRPDDDPAKRTCRWCGGMVPRGRRSWCSAACVHEGLMVAQPGYARAQVEKRDHGVCCSCGLDCVRWERFVARLGKLAYATLSRMDDGTLVRGWYGIGEQIDHPAALHRREQLGIALAILGMWAGHHLFKSGDFHGHVRTIALKHSLWQADHVKPVVEGGGGCGLDNLRTLCLRCHKRVTTELATKRAAEKRPQLPLFGNR